MSLLCRKKLRKLAQEVKLLFLISIFKQVDLQEYSNSCNDPIIQNHLVEFDHTYCSHACGFLNSDSVNATSFCDTRRGNCVCEHPCFKQGIVPGSGINFGSDLCSPQDATPDIIALQRCRATCTLECRGGVGIICGDTRAHLSVAEICTCFCPPQPCFYDLKLQLTTPLVGYLFIKNRILYTIYKKIIHAAWLMIKLYGFVYVKSALIGWVIYSVLQWVDFESRELSNSMLLFFTLVYEDLPDLL